MRKLFIKSDIGRGITGLIVPIGIILVLSAPVVFMQLFYNLVVNLK